MFIIYLDAEFHMLSSSGALVIAVKGECRFCAAAMLLFHILPGLGVK
jgi:hypothetical protein